MRTSKCNVFKGEDLLYFFVGRPAYKKESVLEPHYWELPTCVICEYNITGAKRIYPFDTGAEVLKSGLFTEGPRRAEKRHPLRCFERPAGRHHLAPDMGYTCVIYRAGIAGLQAPDNLRFALRPEYR